jgi:hypothetical protein
MRCPVVAHHDISPRCRIWSLSGHSGLWPAGTPRRFMGSRPSICYSNYTGRARRCGAVSRTARGPHTRRIAAQSNPESYKKPVGSPVTRLNPSRGPAGRPVTLQCRPAATIQETSLSHARSHSGRSGWNSACNAHRRSADVYAPATRLRDVACQFWHPPRWSHRRFETNAVILLSRSSLACSGLYAGRCPARTLVHGGRSRVGSFPFARG